MRSPLLRAWSRFWFTEIDGLPYGAVRVTIGLAALHQWVATVPALVQFYSNAGELPIAAARAWTTEAMARFGMPGFLGSPVAAIALGVLYGILILALILGYRTRLAAVGVALLNQWFFFRNAEPTNGGDELMRLVTYQLMLGYLALAPASRALSLDRRRAERGEGTTPATMPAWPLRLIQIQVVTMYLVAGFWKILGPAWWDGSALYLALDNGSFSRFGAPEWAWLHWPFAVFTLSVAWWELLFGALVVFRRTRVPALLFGVALHLGIIAFMNIGPFPVIVLSCYAAFLTPAELRRMGWVLGGLVGRFRPEPSPVAEASAPGLSPGA